MNVKHRTDTRRAFYARLAILNWLFILIAAAGLLTAFFCFWMAPVRISGDSMSPFLLEDQIVLVSRLSKYWKKPVRGDVIAFRNPLSGSLMLKRVVALPGETVDVSDGKTYIGGRPLDESDYASAEGSSENMPAILVPEGELFVLSDNRADIFDSRHESIGCIPYGDIYGVLRLRIYPFGEQAVFPYH